MRPRVRRCKNLELEGKRRERTSLDSLYSHRDPKRLGIVMDVSTILEQSNERQ
jgi:hypothetical protein